MSPDQPTNQPTTNYLSLRLKLGHNNLDAIKNKIVFDVPDYCIYMHTTSGEHFHVCLPGFGAAERERFAKRVKDKFTLRGNGGYSAKVYTADLSSFVFYSGHEGTAAVYDDPKWKEIIAPFEAGEKPYYVKQDGQRMLPKESSSKKDTDSDWQLTYSNFVPKVVNYARQRALTGGLKEVLQHMLENTRWRPSYHMVQNGVPYHYYDDFEFRTGKRKKMSMDWMEPKEKRF